MVRRWVLAVAVAGAVVAGCSSSPGPAGPQGPQGETGPTGYFDTGCPGPLVDDVCVLQWDNRQATNFLAAASRCAALGGDLCTDSQAFALTVASSQNQYLAPAILNTPHWLSGYADNDGLNWPIVNGGTADDHTAATQYGYVCCGGTTPLNPRVPGTVIGGVWVTYVHDVPDTNFAGAVGVCNALRSDVCTDSQTFLLRKAGALSVPTWTAFHADNDAGLYTPINGGTADDTHPSHQYGFACCGSTRPLTLECPVATTNGVCAVEIHDAQDTTFDGASTACAAQGADLCSMAAAAVLRANGSLTGAVWTSSHSDNDGGDNNTTHGGVAVGRMPQNPNLSSTYGYACCLN